MSYVLRFLAWLLPAAVCHHVFRAMAWCLSRLPRNGFLWAYTIKAKDGRSPYITRCLFPRWRGSRTMLHWIHIPDQDHEMHDHPWQWARGQVLLGRYIEDRAKISWKHLDDADAFMRGYDTNLYCAGDKTGLLCVDWHRIVHVDPRTWTLFRVGERVQDWGFMICTNPIVKMPWQDFFKRKGINQDKVAS